MLQHPKRIAVLLALCCGLLPASPSKAWIDTGHKVISLIAWEELTPATRTKVAGILKEHPRYEKDLLSGLPEGADDAATARHAFAVASTWPDLVRSQGHPMHFAATHSDWHYIDIPYAIEGQAIPATQPSEKQPLPGPHDVVEALSRNVADVKDPAVAGADKAVALCWVLHLVGDIHQPLHAIILYSPQFPKGDQGGNAIVVLRDPPYPNSQMNLHLLWDKLPGDYKSSRFDGYLAAGLRADPRFSREQFKDALTVKDFTAWARESHDLAVEHAYLKGAIKGVPAHQARSVAKEPIPGVPAGYLEQAEQVAARQVVLAAYRSADLLNGIFDPR